MAKIADVYIGARFDFLTVVGEPTAERKRRVLVRCDCGAERLVQIGNLGRTSKSCGCMKNKLIAARTSSHGMRNTTEYSIWTTMKQRTTNPDCAQWPRYGGRGIGVCDRWRDSFEAFLEDVGHRPEGMTLDRLNNELGYEPGNVAWRPWADQAKNRRPQLRDTCSQGHARTPENVHIRPNGARTCRVCDKERQQAKRDAANVA